MLEALVPTEDQERAIEKMVASPTHSAILAAGLGVGKTLLATETVLRLGAKTVLVSAPLHTRHSWADTIRRQTLYTVTPRFVDNKNKAGKQALTDLRDGMPGFYIMGRELFRLTDWTKVKLDAVVHDEAHSLANRRNRGYDVAVDLAKRTKYTICQSATIFGANFSGAWAIGRIVFPEHTPRAFWKFVDEYCATVYDRFDPSGRKIVGEKQPGAFAKSLPCFISLESKSIAKPIVVDHYVDLSSRQRRLYDQFEKDGVVWLESMPMAATVPVVQRIRLRELTLAECSVNDEGEVSYAVDAKSSKLDALQELLADMPTEPVLVVTHSAKYARLVAHRLGTSAFAWTGDKSQNQREDAKQAFLDGGLQYLVATQAAIGEGTNLLQNVCHVMVELSPNDSPILNEQTYGRLARTGQTKPVLVYRITARNTLDDKVQESLLAKKIKMRQSMLKELEGNLDDEAAA